MSLKSLFLLFVFLSVAYISNAQLKPAKNINLDSFVPIAVQHKILTAMDTLLVHISKGKINPDEINSDGAALNNSIISSLNGAGYDPFTKDSTFYKPQLINLYALSVNQYFASVAFTGSDNTIRLVFDFYVDIKSDKVTFSIPLHYHTKNWRTIVIGNITYHYNDHINMANAQSFNAKNTKIATKLGLKPERLDFYLCDNYQQVLELMGYSYDSQSAGVVNEGYGVDEHTIFSIMHNEDFSHDLFHHYAGKVRVNPRNSAAEEGVAYNWGNAYYADDNGHMISPEQLVPELKIYLEQHPQISLLELFTKNPPVLTHQTKVRSLLSSIICKEIEKENGVNAIKELINCGTGDGNYFTVVNKFININPSNFNIKVAELIKKYK